MSSNNQHQGSASFVWYQLVDSASGQPYKNTSADAVSLTPSSFIFQFLDTIKAKYIQEISSILNDIASCQLRVYKNKEAFEKRNALENKEEHLKPSSLLHGLGTSKKDALIVAVPDLYSKSSFKCMFLS